MSLANSLSRLDAQIDCILAIGKFNLEECGKLKKEITKLLSEQSSCCNGIEIRSKDVENPIQSDEWKTIFESLHNQNKLIKTKIETLIKLAVNPYTDH